jgi:tellurite methyltransferase
MRSPWGNEYIRTPDQYIWGLEPSLLARGVVRCLSRGARVLELGSGEGRDSVFFAAQGCEVTAVELSGAGIAKAERLARQRGLTIRWIQADMATRELDGPFDLVYSCGAIHYVPRRERRALFRRLQALTAPRGFHALVVFTDAHIYVEKDEEIDYFRPGELRRVYRGWRLLDDRHEMITCVADGRPHQHSTEYLVAQRRAA